MTKIARVTPKPAKVVQLRKGTTLEMVRLCCPDAGQATLIAESFGLAILDSEGIRETHRAMSSTRCWPSSSAKPISNG